ncbi:hypothetical protein AABB24_035703 [Solanum stoloniferum]|uniref:Ubiquitin-like domain-containing protein n=1 Tax=Solanum stoloniferum TaxID=62892 RepID=A0ABD2R8Z7_9SOLN
MYNLHPALQELKNRISQALPSSSAPNSIHLSLNRKDELQFSEEDTLQSIGITSGDLIFFTQNPIGFSISTETHIPKLKKSNTQIVKKSETMKKLDTQIVQESEIVKEMDTQIDETKLKILYLGERKWRSLWT